MRRLSISLRMPSFFCQFWAFSFSLYCILRPWRFSWTKGLTIYWLQLAGLEGCWTFTRAFPQNFTLSFYYPQLQNFLFDFVQKLLSRFVSRYFFCFLSPSPFKVVLMVYLLWYKSHFCCFFLSLPKLSSPSQHMGFFYVVSSKNMTSRYKRFASYPCCCSFQ